MDILREISKWAKKIPVWQADALRRIWEGGISADDLSELTAMLKHSKGMKVDAEDETLVPKVFEYKAPESTTGDSNGKRICRIHSIQHVNRVQNNAEMTFETKGLTVIYGDNASGKSGYGRVFRRACRARGKHPQILGNLFSKQPQTSNATAHFELEDSAGGKTIEWQDDGGHLEDLATIAMFDKDCARYHIEEPNRVDYLPYGADLLTQLSNTCDAISNTLKEELKHCELKLPETLSELDPEGVTKQFVSAINAKTSAVSLKDFAIINDDEKASFENLDKVVSERKRKSPEKLAIAYRKKSKRITAMHDELVSLEKLLGVEGVKVLREKQTTAKSTQEVAEIASMQDFAKEPVKGVGTKLWQLMFEAAKKFAEVEAFPETKFEESFKDGKCVLCHQDLSEQASGRLVRFDAFIKKDIAKLAKESKEALEKSQASYKRLDTTLTTKNSELLESLGETHPKTAEAVLNMIGAVIEAKKQVLNALDNSKWDGVKPVNVEHITKLKPLSELADKFEEDATAVENQKPTEEQIAEEKQWLDLKERIAFRDSLGTMLDYLASAKKYAQLKECVKEVNTRPITALYSSLVEAALTEELQIALKSELDSIGLDWIRPRFEPKSPKSQLHQRIVLDGIPSSVALTEVLSEGEGLVLAIASFLAELKVAPAFSVVVFDDPVSSLDHLWRDKISERLVSLSKNKQVIVFTHDLYFLFGMIQECGYQKQSHMLVHAIGRVQDETGVVLSPDDRPHEMKRPHDSYKTLQKQIINAQTTLESVGDLMNEEYRLKASRFYDALRRVWERVIEHYLFGDVIARFRPNISFTNLDKIVTGLTPDDVKLIRDSMAKASKWITGHSSAFAARTITPKPTEMTQHLKDMKNCVKSLEDRKLENKQGVKA